MEIYDFYIFSMSKGGKMDSRFHGNDNFLTREHINALKFLQSRGKSIGNYRQIISIHNTITIKVRGNI